MANDTELEREVAVEARAAATLNHSKIATIHNIEEVDEEMFIVMEYTDGQEMKDKNRKMLFLK